MRDWTTFDWFHDMGTLTDAELAHYFAHAWTYVRDHGKICNPHVTHAHDYVEHTCDCIAAEILKREQA